MTTTWEFLFRWWTDEPVDQKKPALVEAAPTKRLSGWEAAAGAKKEAAKGADGGGGGGGGCNVRSELK